MNENLKRALLLSAFAHLALELSNNYLPVIYPLLIDTMDLSFAQIGVVAFVAGFGGSLLQPLFGYLSDRWGPIALTALSVTWTGLVMGLVGLTENYWLLVLLAGLGGLGSAAFHPPGSVIASVSGQGRRRGAAVSIFSVGGNIGSALSPLLVGLGLSWFGLSGTVVLIPVALVSGLFLFVQLRRYYVPSQPITTTIPTDRPETDTQPAQKQAARLAKRGSMFGFILVVVVVMARSWFEMSFKTYLPIWLESQGWSLEAAGRSFVVLLVAVSVGSLGGGALSDRIGRWQVIGLSTLVLAISHWLFVASSGFSQVVFVSLSGVMVGATFPVSIVLAHEMWPQRAGMASALVMGIGWLPGGIGAAVTGRLADQYSLTLGLQMLVLAPLVGLICIGLYAVFQRYMRQKMPLDRPVASG